LRWQLGVIAATLSAVLACLDDDKRYFPIKGWAKKLETAEKILRSAFEFDFAAVSVKKGVSPERYYNNPQGIQTLACDFEDENVSERFIPISSDRIEELNSALLKQRVIAATGVRFFHKGKPIELSSGQRLFTFIVINILGAIRRDSLILIDEPELFLHPSLEIQFIGMLKKILSQFNSKALLAKDMRDLSFGRFTNSPITRRGTWHLLFAKTVQRNSAQMHCVAPIVALGVQQAELPNVSGKRGACLWSVSLFGLKSTWPYSRQRKRHKESRRKSCMPLAMPVSIIRRIR
jgi:hypothetical protein